MSEREIEISREALQRWGIQAQLGMLVEECAELIEVTCHLSRKRVGRERFAEEIADVELMLTQMRINDPILDSYISKWKTVKLQRLKAKLHESD